MQNHRNGFVQWHILSSLSSSLFMNQTGVIFWVLQYSYLFLGHKTQSVQFSPHCSTAGSARRPLFLYRRHCLVCLSVGYNHAKTTEPIDIPFGMVRMLRRCILYGARTPLPKERGTLGVMYPTSLWLWPWGYKAEGWVRGVGLHVDMMAWSFHENHARWTQL